MVFERYMKLRQWQENANDTLERPIMLELIDGECEGAHVLDLGCGNGAFSGDLLSRGALSYTGIEPSHKMIEAAQAHLNADHAQVVQATMEDWHYPESTYELVVSRLALHYVEHLDTVHQSVFHTLRPGGAYVFSVEHPVMTSSYGVYTPPEGKKGAWLVDRYFESGLREQEWLGDQVKKYHRTIEAHFSLLQKAGFIVEQLRESNPVREHFLQQDTYERRKRIPLFLMFRARRPVGIAEN